MDSTIEEIPTHKVCKDCQQKLPLSMFDKHSSCLYGVHPRCKPCRKQERLDRAAGLIGPTGFCEDCGTDISDRPRARLCKSCGKERNRQSALRFYEKDPEGFKQRVKERWENLPKEVRLAKSREQMLKDHGINQRIYDEMLSDQNGVCKTCRKPETHMYQGVVVQLAVDHDHGHCPGKKGCSECVRGLLCHDCNAALGYFNDDLETMRAAIAYLEAWETKKLEIAA